MRIKYEPLSKGQWVVEIDSKPICKITGFDVDEVSKFYVVDLTTSTRDQIPGSPFESLNKAKAVIEYHYRNLL